MSEGLEIRRFGDGEIAASIDRVLAGVPDDHRVAVVAHADGEGVRALTYVRIGSGFSFMGELKKDWNEKQIDGYASLTWSH